jgi:uncharacterized CHY-type Zn-finger protein
MAEKNNAVCSICGKGYYACLSCADAMKIHPWKTYTDTSECYKVFQIVRGFSTGVYTKDEAREKLQNVDLKDVDSFKPHIKKIVKDILKEEKVVVETAEKIENTVVNNVVEVKKTEEVKNVENVMNPTVSRKKFNKMDRWK